MKKIEGHFSKINLPDGKRVCVCVCVCIYIYYIQGVPGGMCQTSGECSLG